MLPAPAPVRKGALVLNRPTAAGAGRVPAGTCGSSVRRSTGEPRPRAGRGEPWAPRAGSGGLRRPPAPSPGWPAHRPTATGQDCRRAARGRGGRSRPILQADQGGQAGDHHRRAPAEQSADDRGGGVEQRAAGGPGSDRVAQAGGARAGAVALGRGASRGAHAPTQRARRFESVPRDAGERGAVGGGELCRGPGAPTGCRAGRGRSPTCRPSGARRRSARRGGCRRCRAGPAGGARARRATWRRRSGGAARRRGPVTARVGQARRLGGSAVGPPHWPQQNGSTRCTWSRMAFRSACRSLIAEPRRRSRSLRLDGVGTVELQPSVRRSDGCGCRKLGRGRCTSRRRARCPPLADRPTRSVPPGPLGARSPAGREWLPDTDGRGPQNRLQRPSSVPYACNHERDRSPCCRIGRGRDVRAV